MSTRSTRRAFLKQGALLSLAPCVPRFLLQSAAAAAPAADGRLLVVVLLDGGNDGLNTVIPWRSEEYARLRPTLKVDPARAIRLDDDTMLHPSLRALAKRVDGGQCAVIQGVGYPNPNRSHFESTRIWQSALLDSPASESLGWLGLATDPLAEGAAARPKNVFVGPTQVPQALNGRRTETLALRRLEDLAMHAPELVSRRESPSAQGEDPGAEDLGRYVTRVAADGYRTALEIGRDVKGFAETAAESALDRQLQVIARLIAIGNVARVFFTVQGGYDTHSAQAPAHAELLANLAVAIDRFFATLESSGHADRVALLTFSEFGRRAAENGGHGTDHGAAAPVFLFGPRVRGGLHGATPSLHDLVDGDPCATVDFRGVYRTLLEDWLQLPALERLQGHEKLALLRT